METSRDESRLSDQGGGKFVFIILWHAICVDIGYTTVVGFSRFAPVYKTVSRNYIRSANWPALLFVLNNEAKTKLGTTYHRIYEI